VPGARVEASLTVAEDNHGGGPAIAVNGAIEQARAAASIHPVVLFKQSPRS